MGTTPTFRVSWPNIFTAKRNDLSGKDEFSLVALFKKGENLKTLETEILAAANDKWGAGSIGKGTVGYTFTPVGKPAFVIRMPFKDQGTPNQKTGLIPAGYEPGALCCNLKSITRPGLVDQNLQDIIDASQFYAGCYARAYVNAYAYDQKGNRGISLGLGAIQKVKDGEPLGNKVNPQLAFEPITDIDQEAGASSLFGE